MLKNNIEVDVKVKRIEAETTPSHVNRLIKKSGNTVNKALVSFPFSGVIIKYWRRCGIERKL